MNLEPGMSGTHLDSDGLLGAVGHQDPPYPHSQSGPHGKAERHCSKCGASSAETPRSGIVIWRDSCCVRVHDLPEIGSKQSLSCTILQVPQRTRRATLQCRWYKYGLIHTQWLSVAIM